MACSNAPYVVTLVLTNQEWLPYQIGQIACLSIGHFGVKDE